MGKTEHTYTMRMTPELRDRLSEHARELGTTPASFVRMAVIEKMEQRQTKTAIIEEVLEKVQHGSH